MGGMDQLLIEARNFWERPKASKVQEVISDVEGLDKVMES